MPSRQRLAEIETNFRERAGAGRPVCVVEVEARACPLRQLLRGCFSIYRTSSMPAFGLGCCDCCHGYSSNSPLFFGRPICASQARRIASLLGLVLAATIILA